MTHEGLYVKPYTTVLTDLHVHTDYSDGSRSPDEVIELAHSIGIRYLALTDHDTTLWFSESGMAFQSKAKSLGISLIRGVEISTRDYKTGKKAHILGYWPWCEPFVPAHLDPLCRIIQERRTQASYCQIAVLQSLGYSITADEVRANSRTDQIFKHNILKTMQNRSFIPEAMGDFYRLHFKKGGDCFFPIQYLDAQEVVAAIRADKGIAVLAHPGEQNNLELIPSLMEAGLSGIEYLHPSHSEILSSLAAAEAEKYGLLKTGGSDYHGAYYPSRILGSRSLPAEDVTALKQVGLLGPM